MVQMGGWKNERFGKTHGHGGWQLNFEYILVVVVACVPEILKKNWSWNDFLSWKVQRVEDLGTCAWPCCIWLHLEALNWLTPWLPMRYKGDWTRTLNWLTCMTKANPHHTCWSQQYEWGSWFSNREKRVNPTGTTSTTIWKRILIF
jgi:hypothetical protein